MSELRQALAVHRPALRRTFFFSLITGLLVLAPVVYMFEVYGRVVDSQSLSTLAWLTVMVVVSYLVLEVMEWGRLELMRAESLRFEQALAPRVFEAMFALNRRSGQVGQTQAIHDLKAVREFFYSPPLMAFLELPTLLVFLVILFFASPLLGLVGLVAAFVQFLIGFIADRKTRPPISQANFIAVEAQRYADSVLRNGVALEAMGMLPTVRQRWLKQQAEVLSLQSVASANAATVQSASKFLQLGISSGLLGLSAWLLLTDQLAGGAAMMIVASTLGARILAPLAQIMGSWRTVVNARDAFLRLEKVLADNPSTPVGMPLPAPQGTLSVESITVTPPGAAAPTLRGISFSLRPGEVLGVMGPSGSGKTSLARALVGLWPTNTGKVRLGGADVFTWNKEELGKFIGYLPQGIELFDGTVAENIARFGPVDQHSLESALAISGLQQWLKAWPNGVNTLLGVDGKYLSRGQMQRVALARAIYGNPVFVVLDEPNSNLDKLGETNLFDLIVRKKAEGMTFVLITHRIEILKAVDKILILRDGAQVAFGPRDEVLDALRQANQKVRQLRG